MDYYNHGDPESHTMEGRYYSTFMASKTDMVCSSQLHAKCQFEEIMIMLET